MADPTRSCTAVDRPEETAVSSGSDDDDPDDELPSRVKYAVILQEEEDFMDEV